MDKRRRFQQSIIPARDERRGDSAASITALSEDIRRFETDHKVPQGLCLYVHSSQEFQADWYEKLSEAWPKSGVVAPEEAAKLVVNALREVHSYAGVNILDLEGFFFYYGLTDYCPPSTCPSRGGASPVAEDAMDNTLGLKPLGKAPVAVDDFPIFLLKTLLVSKDSVTDECLLTVFVEVREFSILPLTMLLFISRRREALGIQIVNANGVERLTKKYQIKLRGINAPDTWTETRDKLGEIIYGKCLTIVVYYFEESCKHWVGDVYCGGIFLLDELLMGGSETFSE